MSPGTPRAHVLLLLLAGGCGAGRAHPSPLPEHTGTVTTPVAHAFPETVHLPYRQLGLNSGRVDVNGKPVRVVCGTCHDAQAPRPENQFANHIDGFHTGVVLQHGDNTCRSCHNPPAFRDFRLQSGQVVNYADVMLLCGQCHGDKLRDYQHGAHGGMTGSWDLDRGPRLRNHCLDCHNAHQPRIPQVWPAPRPRYRNVDAPEEPHG